MPPASLTPVANLPPVLLAPVAPCEYLREFSKKFEMTLVLFSGTWRKMIHEKNLKQKNSRHCPFKSKDGNLGGSSSNFLHFKTMKN
jgi:hypothetical protein